MRSDFPSAGLGNIDCLSQFFGDLAALRQNRSSHVPAGALPGFFGKLGGVIETVRATQLESDRHHAGRFNVFELIEPDENRFSDVLQFLLDPRGHHGQGDLFLRLLLERLNIFASPGELAGARARREAPTDAIPGLRRRIDLLIEASALVGVENKVDSSDHPEQIADYLRHLHQYSGSGARHYALIYLTPSGRWPGLLRATAARAEMDAGRLHCWSYAREIRQWLEACRAKCQAPKIGHFLGDFISYIDTVLRRPQIPDERNEYER